MARWVGGVWLASFVGGVLKGTNIQRHKQSKARIVKGTNFQKHDIQVTNISRLAHSKVCTFRGTHILPSSHQPTAILPRMTTSLKNTHKSADIGILRS